MDARKDNILRFVIDNYVETAVPVGSGAVCRDCDLGLSSATIRNIMADLEEEGYLTHPYTSAGRIPTDKGYRYYISSLLEYEKLQDRFIDAAQTIGREAAYLDDLMEDAASLLSEMTNEAAVVAFPRLGTSLIDAIKDMAARKSSLDERFKLLFSGASRVFGKPEFKDMGRISSVMKVFEEKKRLLDILKEDSSADDGVKVHIGNENSCIELSHCTLITCSYKYNGEVIGTLGVIGPTRMKYARVIPELEFVSGTLTDYLAEIL